MITRKKKQDQQVPPFRSTEEEDSDSDESYSPPASPPAQKISCRGRKRTPPASLGRIGTSSQSSAPATDGTVRRRMKWTEQINKNVMTAYYRSTEGETRMTAYRSRLLSAFQELEPSITVSAQRLADQVRVIQTRKFLDDSTLDELRRVELPSTSNNIDVQSVLADINDDAILPTQHQICQSVPVEVVNNVDDDSVPQCDNIRSILDEAILEFEGIDISSRPRIPRLPLNKRNMIAISTVDSVLRSYFEKSNDLVNTHLILYCAAVTVCRVVGLKFNNFNNAARQYSDKPAWQLRIEKRIDQTRVLIAKLICFKSGNHRPRVMRFVSRAFAGTDIHRSQYMDRVTERIHDLKQKVYAWANRIRRYRKRVDRFRQNRLFQNEQKRVYRNWEDPTKKMRNTIVPNSVEFTRFWENIWSQQVSHTDGSWNCDVMKACENIRPMEKVTISADDIILATRRLQNWKSPGPDGLQNFWLKWFKSSHIFMASQFQEALDSRNLPNFLCTGITHLLHKTQSTTDPKNYRPITCLPSMFKLLTSILREKINNHLDSNKIISYSQNGCRLGSRGTKELLLMDAVINQQIRRKKGSLSTAWIDYKKAFDSVPHSWLIKVLEIYKIDSNLSNFLELCMGQWATRLRLPCGDGSFQSSDLIQIRRGIFQGDTLSPLWFCLALNPLSTLLDNSGLGYMLKKDGESISHLLYMDDLKLFSKNEQNLIQLLKVTESFSNDIKMEFGLEKCAIMNVKKGKIVESENIRISDTTEIRCLSEHESYKYLGMSEALGISSIDVKESVKQKFFSRLTKVFNSLLSGGNKIRAFNGWVMPVLSYSFGILKWTQGDLDGIDRKVRSVMTKNRMLHPRSSVMRLYIPRKNGGRGMLNAKDLHNREIYELRKYFLSRGEDGIHREFIKADLNFTPLNLGKENWQGYKVMSVSDRMDVWKSKELHGRYHKSLNGPDVDPIASVHWLRFADLFGETEGFVCAIQDEVIKTNNYRRYVIKDGTLDICRACHQPGESIRHIISGCSHLANGEYLHRHNQVARIVHQQLALKYNLVDFEVPYYKYVPQPVLENDRAIIYWDRSVITDRNIVANKPDIVVIDRLSSFALIIDVSVPHDGNLIKAEIDKLAKYQDLAFEITSMWRLRSVTIVPIILSANGLIAKSFDHHLAKLSLDSWIKGQMQKAVLLDTARIVRKFLSLQV